MKRLYLSLLLFAITSVYASDTKTINKYGFAGVNKTQSAQTLGHSKLSFSILGNVTNDFSMIEDRGNSRHLTQTVSYTDGSPSDTSNAYIDDFMGINGYVSFAIGIGSLFDIGVTLPVYYERFTPESDNSPITGTDVGNSGNLKGDIKLRLPLPDYQPFDIAIYGGVDVGTTNTDEDGMWVHEPEYIHTSNLTAESFGTRDLVFRGGGALTIDFGKLDGGIPWLFHFNGGYRYAMPQDDGTTPYLNIMHGSVATEFFFFEFLSLFAEYYMDIMPEFDNPTTGQKETLDIAELTGALVFHIPVGLDIHVGGTYSFVNEKYISNLNAYHIDDVNHTRSITYNGRIIPEYSVYGGITWSGFLLPQDRDDDTVVDKEDSCPDEFGHIRNGGCPFPEPDIDGDGFCDSWVSEKGFLDIFADVCKGVDECPNEKGEGKNGCPLDNPDTDADRSCDPWVKQKKMSKRFKGVWKGVDSCPTQAGPSSNKGCPHDNPDVDSDGICDPWVSQKDKLSDFANLCKGYDNCPGEPGPAANKGCPWPDPDTDGDGLCDEWVIKQKMGYFFENPTDSTVKKCKSVDKCPYEFGPADNEGCPFDNPDTDNDSVCDQWVALKKQQERFANVCKGSDKCPTEAGLLINNGCPVEDPDIDKDSLCAPWVKEKGMQDQFKTICKGIDNCPTEFGPKFNGGCPIDDPDPDKDSVCASWVTEKGMLDQFKDVCKGSDKCPTEVGPLENKGCSLDDPDVDKDSVCLPGATEKGLLKQFETVCKGADRCPTEVGPFENKGCPLDDPDLDKDSVCASWVSEKGLQKFFVGVCDGVDKCPLDAGSADNFGCPLDDPDTDKDGVCDPWVTQKKLPNKFANVCKGLDRCPLDSGSVESNGCPVKKIEENVKLEGVTFKSGSSILEPNAKKVLKTIAEQLLAPENASVNIEIHGHTDNVGRPAKNKKLSLQRAQSVVNYLASQGVPKKRMKAFGHGDEEPVADNSSSDGRELNRRIEMHRTE